jgi:hypothetical protein
MFKVCSLMPCHILKRFPDRAIIRFQPGMLARRDAMLKPDEDRVALILAATAAALRKAEREQPRDLLPSQGSANGNG